MRLGGGGNSPSIRGRMTKEEVIKELKKPKRKNKTWTKEKVIEVLKKREDEDVLK